MTGTGSPCGACKFLRRKCMRGCVFAPYFCHEQGSSHFSAIHKVFGARNVSKLLAHLPVSERSDAAVTIAYEAQARLQDPIYGCVSHIFALQKQVVSLQAQLASLKQLALQSSFYGSSTITNPSDRFCEDVQGWFQSGNSNMMAQLDPNLSSSLQNFAYENCFANSSSFGSSYGNPISSLDENTSFWSLEEASYSMDSLCTQPNANQWQFQQHLGGDELHSNGSNMDGAYDYEKCIGLKVKPRQGDGLFFYSLYPNGTIDQMSLHGSCPVVKGEKWVATKWLRDQEQDDD